jgi:hypothetical protein
MPATPALLDCVTGMANMLIPSHAVRALAAPHSIRRLPASCNQSAANDFSARQNLAHGCPAKVCCKFAVLFCFWLAFPERL